MVLVAVHSRMNSIQLIWNIILLHWSNQCHQESEQIQSGTHNSLWSSGPLDQDHGL